MRRSTLLLLLGCVFMAFGYTKQAGVDDGSVSKIYLFGSTLIRTTPDSDIRFYDIANPASVREVGKITIDGNSDVAATGSIMYADQNFDLIVFDISDPAKPRALDTIRKVFNNPASYVPRWEWEGDDVMVDEDVGGMSGCGGCGEEVMVDAPTDGSANGGIGGSLARFMIVGDYLYCIDAYDLTVFDISQPERPVYRNKTSVGWEIETIFHAKNSLFIGGRQGVYIYGIDDADNPQYKGEFQHANRCDPVVVEGDRAYVTLRGGTPCGGFSNQLDILDVSNLNNPQLIKTIPMESPYGLAVQDGVAMICEGEHGLKIFRIDQGSAELTSCGGIEDITAYDVIWYNNLLIVTADEGFFLYDATNPCEPKPFGKLF